MSYYNHHTQAPPDGTPTGGVPSTGDRTYTRSGERRDRRSSDYAMNVDSLPVGDMSMYAQPPLQQQLVPMQPDYHSYSTTTAQMIDPWSFNHAHLLSHLSQLPPDLFPSLMPQMNQMQYHANSRMTAQNMSNAAAMAAVAAAAAASVSMAGIGRQPLSNEHSFAMPAIPLHRQPSGTKVGGGPATLLPRPDDQQSPQHHFTYQREPAPATQFQPQRLAQFPQLPRQQQQQQPSQPQQQNAYAQNLYYNTPPSLQPLMQPPPSPTILSYYTADPTQWMSLLGQNAYQPQAYHYDYPVPPHQLPFNFPMQQQQQQRRFPAASAMAGGSGGAPAMLLTQQYAPPGPLQIPMTPVTLPPIDQALHQSNMAAVVAAQMVAAAAAASATGQYPQAVANGSGSGMAFPAMPQQQLQSLQFESQNTAVGASAYVPTVGLPQQQQQLEGYYQPVRRSSSVTNLALLHQQQQQQQQQQQPSLAAGFGAQSFLSGSATGLPNQAAAASILSGANIMPSFQQQQQQQGALLGGTPGYYTGTGGYVPSQSVFNSVGARPPALNASRSHGAQQQAGPRISIAQKAQQNLSSLLGSRPKGASNYLQALASSSAGVVDVNTPQALPGTADYVPGTRFARQQAAEESVRDHILQNAHLLYSSNARSPVLIEMLLCLHQLHPRHLPTLLLLACAYFSSGQADKSLEYNELILKIDPNYVEAMSNIGTTLRSMGKAAEAENWWWQAVKLRPGYWDAVENLMGVLCNPSTGGSKDAGGGSGPRYREALQLCEFVDNSLRMGDEVSRGGTGTVGKYQVQEKQLSRLQSLLYSEGNLRLALGDVAGARREYEKALEAVLGGYRLDEVIVRIASVGAHEGINQMFHQQLHHQPPPSHNLSVDSLPLTLLAPENAVRILQTLFPDTRGVLPGFVGLSSSKASSSGSATSALQQANHVASNLVLQLAKLHQDHAVVAQPLSIVLPLYYMSLALEASPSTCNNLGIILSAIPSPQTATLVPSLQGGQQAAQAPMGSALAMQYYTQGLGLDRRHPHLYTNLGSLLKDLGYVAEAVRMYEKAVEFNPTFDVALANLGNAIKDMGRVQESVAWYLRAVQASPNFVEAVCGLANAMAGVCDWRARDGLKSEMAVRWQATALESDEMAEQIFLVMSRGKRPTAPEYALKLRKMINYNGSPKESPKNGALVVVADKRRGWMDRVVEIADQQLSDGRKWGNGLLVTGDPPVPTAALTHFVGRLCQLLPLGSTPPGPLSSFVHAAQRAVADASSEEWQRLARQLRCEGGWALRLAERVMAEVQRRQFWGTDNTINLRPQMPTGLSAPSVPTVLPFHTFTYPLDAREIRLISHRNALRLSFSTLSGGAPWLPRHVYPPPPQTAVLRIGYVSSDFNNHPLAHLMQSVFGMHDRRRFQVICYATTAADGSAHRQKIEAEADVFVDCAAWSTARIVEQIASDGIHVLVNLNGYTKGARNEIFAARPAPVLVAFMGFAGTLGAGWCDYVVTDPIVCPPWTVRCEMRAERLRLQNMKPREMQEVKRGSDYPAFDSWDFGELDPEEDCGDWVYTERMIYMPHTYFVNDHRQGFREDEDVRGDDPESVWRAEVAVRWRMRQSVFPQLDDDAFIFANFNQLYKIDPALFRMWLRILERCPRAVIWLLRFPAAGEQHLRRVALEWSGPEVASRVVFTDVAPKHVHIKRGCVADAFLDTPECNAHTTAVDILWSGTPVLTWPRHEHKLCSRVAASVVCATGHGRDMVVGSAEEYIERAVEWAQSASHRYEGEEGPGRVRVGCGPAADLRRQLFLARDQSRLFDTERWTRNLERGLEEAWRRWTTGEDDAPMAGIDVDDEGGSNVDDGGSGDEEQRKLKWAERIERRLLANKSSSRPAVYAPPGRSIWVCDEDDGMPAHSWLRQMGTW